jgi:hypothetical protein
MEEVLESTLFNLMQEAASGDFDIFERPVYVEVNESTEHLFPKRNLLV